MTVTITLPLPPKELSPNYATQSRGARMGKAEKAKDYREHAMVAVMERFGTAWKPRWKTAYIRVEWYHKTRLFPDGSNIVGWLKAAEDGLQDAALIQNDSGVTWLPVERYKDAINPRVVIHISDTMEIVKCDSCAEKAKTIEALESQLKNLCNQPE